MDYVLEFLNFFFYMMKTNFIQLKEEWMHNLFVLTTAGRKTPW